MKFALSQKHSDHFDSPEISTMKQEIEKWDATISRLSQREATGKTQLGVIEAERQDLLISALADGDETSKSQLLRLGDELERVQQEMRDCTYAVAQAEAKRQLAVAQLAHAERLAGIAKTRTLVESRLEAGHDFQTTCDQLLAQFRELVDNSTRVHDAMVRLAARDPNLTRVDRILCNNALAFIRREFSRAGGVDIMGAYTAADATFAEAEQHECECLFRQLDHAAAVSPDQTESR